MSFSPDMTDSALSPLQRILNAATRFVADLPAPDFDCVGNIARSALAFSQKFKTRGKYKLSTLMHACHREFCFAPT